MKSLLTRDGLPFLEVSKMWVDKFMGSWATTRSWSFRGLQNVETRKQAWWTLGESANVFTGLRLADHTGTDTLQVSNFTCVNWARLCRGKTSGLYSGSGRFESLSEQRLSWESFSAISLTPSRQIPGQYLDKATTACFPNLSISLLMNHHSIRRHTVLDIDDVVKGTITNIYT
jgi:hypothetical protein